MSNQISTLRMEQKFKKTPAGEIPVDWEVVKLGDKISLEYGEGLIESKRKYGKYPVYGSNGIIGYHDNFLIKGPGIVVGRKGTIGAVSWSNIDFWPIDTTYYIKLFDNDLNLRWLYYKLKSLNLSKLNMATGTPGLNRDIACSQIIPLPPPIEQKKIADILSAVDDAIDKTGAVIEKTKELKKGLMQILFTKGIQKGRLKTQDFKETEIGRIPKDWKILPAYQVCKKVTDGTHDTPKPATTGYYLVTSKNIKNGGIDFSDAYLINNSDFYEVNKRSKVDSYDVLFSMIGTVGQTTVVTEDYPQFAIKNVGLFKTNKNKWIALWLYYYFCSKFAQSYIKSNVKGTSQKYLPLNSLRNIPIIVPPPSEQKNIVEVLSTVDIEMANEEKHKHQLEEIKTALMQVLLTGKVRV